VVPGTSVVLVASIIELNLFQYSGTGTESRPNSTPQQLLPGSRQLNYNQIFSPLLSVSSTSIYYSACFNQGRVAIIIIKANQDFPLCQQLPSHWSTWYW